MTTFTQQDVRRLLSETVPQTDWSTLAEDASLENAGVDSLDKATLFLKIEEEVGTRISDDAYEDLDSIAAIVAFVG